MMKLTYGLLFLFIVSLAFTASAQDVPAFPRAETATYKPPRPDDEKLAAEYINNKEFEKAVVLYEKLFDEKGTHFYYTYYMYCLIELQDYKTALQITRKQQRNDPDRLRYMVDEGFIHTLTGDQKKAEKIFDDALKNIEADPGQIRNLANAFNYRGQTNYAIRTFEQGRELVPDYPFNLDLARIYERLENYGEMVKEYLNLIEIEIDRMDLVKGRLQSALDNDTEGLLVEELRTELLRRVQRAPEKTFYADMLIWYSVQQKDFEMALIQSKSLDRRLQEDGSRVYELGQLCLSNKAYDVAIDAFEYLMGKGANSPLYLEARIGLLNARYMKVTNRYDYTQQDLIELENEYLKALAEFGENTFTVPIMRYLAHLQAFYLDRIDTAINILNKAVEMPAVSPMMKAECKIELADILLFKGDVWDATLLYSQVDYDFKNDPLGHLAKYKNARLSYYIGEFKWAKAQLDVLKAATSKLIANDAMDLSLLISDNIDMDSSYTALRYYSQADLLAYRNKFDEALITLDSIQMVSLWHPLHDEVLFKKGEIYIQTGDYQKSDSLLAKVVEMYPEDILSDNALMIRADLQERHFGNTDLAMDLYGQLMKDYPGSLFVVEARKRFRELRGDMVN
ncbi:MAG: tetratricopeptide repeat protein [Bacteroidales bacterium]